MAKRAFEVFIYYSTFHTQTVEADNAYEAINIARKRTPDYDQLLANLEPWEDADTAEEGRRHENSTERDTV